MQKIDKKSYKEIGIYNIGYVTIKKIGDCKNIYSLNPLYLLVDHAIRYIEGKGVNKYLIFDSTDENKEFLKKYNDVWNGIKNKIKEVSSDRCDYLWVLIMLLLCILKEVLREFIFGIWAKNMQLT